MIRNVENSGRASGAAKEILLEMGNIGTGSSMASLSHIIGKRVTYGVPVLSEVDCDRLAEWIGFAEENVVAVLIPFHGDIGGMLLQIYKRDMMDAVLAKFLDSDPVQDGMDGRRLDLIREVANIMASSYLTALSFCGDLRISLSESAVSMDMTGAIITALVGTAAGTFPDGICIGNKFSTGENTGESCMLLVLCQEAAEKIVSAVEVTG